MAGRHEFPPTPEGYVARCKYCGKTEEYLDARRVDGKLPPCPDAPAENLGSSTISAPGMGVKRGRDWLGWFWGWFDQSPNEPLLYRYFVVSAKIIDSKTHSRYRKRIYQDASLHGAMYDIRGPLPSIWYPDGSNDLHIALMFDSKREAHKLKNSLIEYNIGTTSLLRGKLEVAREVVELCSAQEGTFVSRDDYRFEDSDSPSNTFDDIKSPSEVPVTHDPIQELRSLENINQLAPGDTLYKCHIAPQAFYKDYARDSNNIILGSHLFHIYFDGDGKRRPAGANLDWGIPPRFKMEYESTGPDHMHNGTRYFMIRVLITFQDPRMARAMEGRWREGTQAVGDLQFRSYFYTTKVDDCVKYIGLKKQETEARWEDGDMEE